MKIAIIAEILNPKSGARAPIELAKQLSKNHQIYFYAYQKNCDPETLETLGKSRIKVILFQSRFLSMFQLYFQLKKQTFDILSLHCFLPLFLPAKLSEIPTIRTYYGTQQDVWFEKLLPDQRPNITNRLINSLLNQIIKTREKFFFDNSGLNIAISKYTQKEAQILYGKKVPYIYLGADISQTPKHLKNSETITFLSVSRITPYKNFHLIIEAFKKVNQEFPKTSLVIAGSSPNSKYLNYLKNLSNNSYNIKILTDVSDSELKQLYQKADVYLSADRYSFFGLPPLEAASFGIPTIALNFAALPEIIQDKKTGYIAKNPDELVELMEKMAGNPKLAEKVGYEARAWSKENFTWEKYAAKYHKIITKQLART